MNNMLALSSPTTLFIVLSISLSFSSSHSLSLRLHSSNFLGNNAGSIVSSKSTTCNNHSSTIAYHNGSKSILTMRKQKASDKRTTRLQRGGRGESDTMTSSSENLSSLSSLVTPTMKSSWTHKSVSSSPVKNTFGNPNNENRGRGRSRKRSQYYSSLSSYHSHFLNLITAEFIAEEEAVRERIESSYDNPLSLEVAGHALFDLYPERRGNIFSDEVYRLVKSYDATSQYLSNFDNGNKNRIQKENDEVNNETDEVPEKIWKQINSSSVPSTSLLPPNNKFSQNDVIMLTLQPGGTGDYFERNTMPTNTDEAISIEARVLNTGPHYIDVAIPAGKFDNKFGPAPNNKGASGKGDPNMRLRADRYFSNVPFNRMVGALSQLTAVDGGKNSVSDSLDIDDSIRQAILTTFSIYNDPSNPSFQDPESSNLQELSKQLSRPPLKDSTRLANEVLNYLQSDRPNNLFPRFNGPQLACIGAALTRKLTMIQGPPGTGKTTVAASIAFGFVHQCRNISSNHKVLATAFSNCGADNLAEQLIRIGLKVVRVGKASAVSPVLWDYTLDAAIEKDPEAKKAMEDATLATANVSSRLNGNKNTRSKLDTASARNKRDVATRAVKASIEACNAAAAKAMREADVIVCTSVGAADARLLAACGITSEADDEEIEKSVKNIYFQENTRAPDGGPPLKMPFILIDEACQSVEPATLIPLVSTNSCRSLVMLGDPCQLPPTVISDSSGMGESPLALSLMSRLASSLPSPIVVTAKADKSPKEEYFMNLKTTRKAVSLVRRKNDSGDGTNLSYRKKFSGSMLLSVQYRMHPSIAAFSSSVFYDGLLSTPAFMTKSRSLPRVFADVLAIDKGTTCVRMVNIGGRNNEKRGDNASLLDMYSGEDTPDIDPAIFNESISNEAEAKQIVGFLNEVMTNNTNELESPFEGSIGIITPYSAQVALIKSMISQDVDLISSIRENNISIEVNSVDAFQGRECDVILFSAVRSNRRDNVGFLSDWRRMNVALTRAKSGLIVFGDISTLKRGDKHWEGFCTWVEGLDCVFDVRE